MRESILSWCTLSVLSRFVVSRSNRRADLVALIGDYAERANAHDIPALMRMFTEDAELELVGQDRLSDLAAIQALHEYDRGINTTLTFYNCVADGLGVTCQVREQNDWLQAAGLDEILYTSSVFTFTEAGRIRRIVATISPEDGAAMGRVLADFIPWLLAERPERSAPLFAGNGHFIYHEANGVLVVELLREWQAACR